MTPPPTTEQATADATQASPAPALSGNDLLLWSALPDLTLNIAQTAALCGVSVRQLGYWTKQGYVTATGRGARRLYGPESLRRILAIRQSMQGGLSLRQSLRALDEGRTDVLVTEAETGGALPDMLTPARASLSPADSEAVTADLLALFVQNQQTRDSVGGLSVKLGRAEGDVLPVVERMAARGALRRTFAGSEAVYALPEVRAL